MDCRAFRQNHGDWADDVLDPRHADRLARHVAECPACARFDTLARRAVMVARNAPQLQVSSDFSARLAARIAEERQARIAQHAPSTVERAPSRTSSRSAVWYRVAAGVAAVAGSSLMLRGTTPVSTARGEPTSFTSPFAEAGLIQSSGFMPASATAGDGASAGGEIVVVRGMRPVGGALLPYSDDPLLDGSESVNGDATATSVAATAPLWPTAQMAALAAKRFAAMEFGDVMMVNTVHSPR